MESKVILNKLKRKREGEKKRERRRTNRQKTKKKPKKTERELKNTRTYGSKQLTLICSYIESALPTLL